MNPTTVPDILTQLTRQLPIPIPQIPREELIHEFGLIKSTRNLDTLRKKVIQPARRPAKIISLLFSHPATELAKSEIIPFLTHYHLRSSDAVDVYCMGYGNDWPDDHFVDQSVVAKVGNDTWQFSETAFHSSIDDFQQQTRWRYSGETDLILLNCMLLDDNAVHLDLESAMVCNLEQMIRDEAISSVRHFFNAIFTYVNDAVRQDPTWGFSDKQGVQLVKGLLKDSVLGLLPDVVAKKYRQGEHLAVRDISLG